MWGRGVGCCRQTDPLAQVQLRVARIFLWVGRLHPISAIEYEMRMMLLVWEAKRRCIEFWINVLRMKEK